MISTSGRKPIVVQSERYSASVEKKHEQIQLEGLLCVDYSFEALPVQYLLLLIAYRPQVLQTGPLLV